MQAERMFDSNNHVGVKQFTPLPSNPKDLTRADALKVFTLEAAVWLVKEVNKR